MPEQELLYKRFCWSLGTTIFRTKNFNLRIERQLQLLHDFWESISGKDCNWSNNTELQENYYDFMKKNQFVEGDAAIKSKDAREKTSGLVDIGLIDKERRLTAAGEALRKISLKSDFKSDHSLQLPKDSFMYFKQLLKTSDNVDGDIVRPYIVLSYLLLELDYLTKDEFTYLLPLCITKEKTISMKDKIRSVRSNDESIDEIILETLMQMENYQLAWEKFLNNDVDEKLICSVGMNRKSRDYDKPYYQLYQELKKLYLDHEMNHAAAVFETSGKIKIGSLWKKTIFNTTHEKDLKKDPGNCLNNTMFSNVENEQEFKKAFFKTMHLLKAKATLKDYSDLNKRYFKLTDTIIFEDNQVKFDIIPKHFIKPVISDLFKDGFQPSDKLYDTCELKEIAAYLKIDKKAIIAGSNKELGGNIKTIEEAKTAVLDERLKRFNEIIDKKFKDKALIDLLNKFEERKDSTIQAIVTDNADIPTIFEYILGVIWYKVSGRKGNILKFMNLSLDSDLLPKTHAGGGEADIVYEYEKCKDYSEHSMLLEATLADGSNQRRMEMEPVSRHLGQHISKSGNQLSYCVFVSTYLDRNVIVDFIGKKSVGWYDENYHKIPLKIIPLQTNELKEIISKKLTYEELYKIFDDIFKNVYGSVEMSATWYQDNIASAIK